MSGFGQLDLWRLAGRRSYERGEGYVDAVVNLRHVDGGLRATVHGTEPYRVRLSWAGGVLTGDCSCPFGEEGNFCKHCVAVGLSWIDGDPDGDPDGDTDSDGDGDSAKGGGARGDRDGWADWDGGEAQVLDGEAGDLRPYLESLNHDTLVDLLCEYAAEDDTLYDRLSLMATRNGARVRRR